MAEQEVVINGVEYKVGDKLLFQIEPQMWLNANISNGNKIIHLQRLKGPEHEDVFVRFISDDWSYVTVTVGDGTCGLAENLSVSKAEQVLLEKFEKECEEVDDEPEVEESEVEESEEETETEEEDDEFDQVEDEDVDGD